MTGIHFNAVVGAPGAGAGTLLSPDQLYFSSVYPNYANSPPPNPAHTVNGSAPNRCGIRKFVDSLPLLNQANFLGTSLPIAVPDTIAFPGSDYYEISLVNITTDCTPTCPRWYAASGYVQADYGTDATGKITTHRMPSAILTRLSLRVQTSR